MLVSLKTLRVQGQGGGQCQVGETELVIVIPRQGFSPVLCPEITRQNF